MTFERFAEFIDRYRLGRDKFERWANATETYFEDCMMGFIPDDSLPIDILRDIFEDDEDWIGYWLYELEFGVKWRPGTVTIDDVDIPLGSVKDLYDFLVKNMEEKKYE